MNKLQTIFNENKDLTIAKVAAFLKESKVSAAAMTKKSKEPIVGEVYNPEAINFKAIEEYLVSKKINIDTIDWKAVVALEAEEKVIEMTLEVGDTFKMKYKPYSTQVWQLVYKTATHVCVINNESTEPKVLAHKTIVEGCKIIDVNKHSFYKDSIEELADAEAAEAEAQTSALQEAAADEADKPKSKSKSKKQKAE